MVFGPRPSSDNRYEGRSDSDMNLPKPVSASHPIYGRFADWLNSLLAAVVSQRILEGPKYRLERKPTGTIFHFDFEGGGRAAVSNNFALTMFRVKTFTAQNSINAVEWNGLIEGASTITIAKLENYRMSNVSELVDGTTITHVYSDANHRTSYDGVVTQHEVLWPRYALDAVIVAAKSSNGTGVANADYFDLTPRVWLAID